MGIVFDTELGEKLIEKIKEMENDSVGHMRSRSLSFDAYQQSLGYLQALSQVRDVLIPETIKEIQESK